MKTKKTKRVKKPPYNEVWTGVWIYHGEPTVYVSLTKEGLYERILPDLMDWYEDEVGHAPAEKLSPEGQVDAYFEALQKRENYAENLTVTTEYLSGSGDFAEGHPLYEVLCETICRIQDAGKDCPDDVRAMLTRLQDAAESLR